MTGPTVDLQFLTQFEAGLDVRRPDRSAVPVRVLDYGQMSTVLLAEGPGAPNVVFKRLPVFRSKEEAGHFEALHRRYAKTLSERAGVRVAPTTTMQVPDASQRHTVLYIIQERLPEDTICHMALYRLPRSDFGRMLMGILNETTKVFDLNRVHQGDLEVGFDAELANWALVGFDPEACALPDRLKFTYIETRTPLMRRHGQEQLDPAPFLRAAPAVLHPLIRRTVLPDLLSRYYDVRRVAIDLVARIQKVGRADLVPDAIDTVNWFFLAERREHHFRPITIEEIRRYHRWDALIWRMYLWLRRIDQRIYLVRRKPYPYILPSLREKRT